MGAIHMKPGERTGSQAMNLAENKAAYGYPGQV